MITMKMARVGVNLTQQKIAELMGIHVQTYAKYEHNPGLMSVAEAKIFCGIVGKTFDDISFSSNSN